MTTASNPVSRVGAGMTGHPRLAAAMLLAALFVALVTKVVVMTGASTSNPSTALAPAPVVFRQGPWRDAIPSDAQIAPDSDAIVRYLSSRPHPAVANIYEYGVPIYDAGPDTPKHVVHCTATWGQCDLEHRLVPIPDDVRASTGSDRAMVVVDWSSRLSYEFWQATRVGDSWQASWGGVTQIDGAGTTDGPVGAGVSRLAGLVRIGEMQRGRIDHALVFSTSNACRGRFRSPATKSDGTSDRPDCLPQGTRIQLDPRVDVDALPDTTLGERVIAKALQTYGAYAIDNGGAKMAFIFETPHGPGNPYVAVGLDSDYSPLDHIPWPKLRVVR